MKIKKLKKDSWVWTYTRQVDSTKKDYAAIVIRNSTGARWFSRFWNLL